MHHVSSSTPAFVAGHIHTVPPVRRNEPSFILKTQESRVAELISDAEGVQKEAHVVIKSQPFAVTLGLKDSTLNFHNMRLEATLLYDSSRDPIVLMEGGCPIAFSSEILCGGAEVKITMKIKVLSSHYAGQYFVVRIRGLHQASNLQLSPGLNIDTHPIRVVSKPSSCVPLNMRGKRGNNTTAKPEPSSLDTKETSVPNFQLLSKVEELLQGQNRLLELMGAVSDSQPKNSKKRKALACKDSGDECLATFKQFATAYEASALDERPAKLRKVIAEFPELVKDLAFCAYPSMPFQKYSSLEVQVSSELPHVDLPWDTVFGSDLESVEYFKNRYRDPVAVGTINETFDEWLRE